METDMKTFNTFITEKKMAQDMDLDMDFLRRAEKVTSFNLTAKDFESLKHKREIQYLFNKNWFPDFNLKDTVKGVDATRLNQRIRQLRTNDPKNFEKMHKYPLKGIGPGEATLYFLIDDGHLGGGSSAGVDLVVGSKKYEVKAVNITSNNEATNFKLGATFSTSSIITGIQRLKKEAGLGAGSEVNKTELEKIRQKFPTELAKFEQDYVNLAYNNYFKSHEIIFIRNTGRNIGDIEAVKKVGKKDIRLERVTSGVIKPVVKL